MSRVPVHTIETAPDASRPMLEAMPTVATVDDCAYAQAINIRLFERPIPAGA
jgi:hypothetical protein